MLYLLPIFSKFSIEVAAHDLLSWLFANQTIIDGLASPEADGLQLQSTSPVTLCFFFVQEAAGTKHLDRGGDIIML